jgi:hypothetical protein
MTIDLGIGTTTEDTAPKRRRAKKTDILSAEDILDTTRRLSITPEVNVSEIDLTTIDVDMNPWQDISNAPRDGTRIILKFDNGFEQEGYWRKEWRNYRDRKVYMPKFWKNKE